MMGKALIRKYWRPLLAVWAACLLGIAVMVGLSGGCLSLERSTEDYLATYRYYDASITTELTADDVASILLAVPGVTHVDARAVANTVMVGPSQRILSIRALTYEPDDRQRFVVWESAPTHGRDAVLVEYEFALDNGIKAGDELRVRVGEEYRSCLVEGLVSAPETLSVRAIDNLSSMNSDFGYVYVPAWVVAREPNHEHDDAQAELDQRQTELDEAQVEARETYEQALAELEAAHAELASRVQEAQAALAALAQLRATLDEGEQTAQDGLAQLQDKQHELSQAQAQLEPLRDQLLAALRQAQEAEDALRAKRAELEQARGQLTATIEELEGYAASLEEAQRTLKAIDDGMAAARALEQLLASDAVQQLVNLLRGMDPATPLPPIALSAEALSEFRKRAEEYGILTDVPTTLHELAQLLLDAMDTVDADCQLLQDPASLDLAQRIDAGDTEAVASQEAQALANVVRRYTTEPLSEESLLLAQSRSASLQTLVVDNDLRDFANGLFDLPDQDYGAWLDELAHIEDTVKAIRNVLGDDCPKISTVGELLEVYDKLPDAIKSALAKLEAARAEVVTRLEEAGVAEQDLPDALEQVRAATARATEGLAQVDEGLAAIDAALSQARAGIDELDAGLAKTEDGLAQVDAGRGELSKLREEALEALRLIDEARGALDAGQAQALDGLATLDSLRAGLQAKDLDAQDQWTQGLVEFSRLRDELERARQRLGSWQGYQAFHNQFLLWFEEGADPEATFAAARAALGNIEIESSFAYADSPVKLRLDENVVPLRALSYYMPSVFLSVVLIVAFLFMSLMVRQSRADIGILRALGKSAGEVRTIFCGVGLLVTVAAILPGLAIGWAIVRYTASYYSDFFHLPAFTCRFDSGMLSLALVLTVVVVQVATLIGTSLVSAIQPSEALSRAVPVSVRVPRVVERLTERCDELTKFSLVSLLRNPLRMGFSVVCIAASVAIILASQSFIASKNHLVYQEFDQRLRYDCQVFFSHDPNEQDLAQLEELGCVRDLQRMGFYACTIPHGAVQQEATINALAYDSDMVGIYDGRGAQIAVPREGIVLDEHLARELGVDVGDTVVADGVELRVEALSRQDSHRVQYVSLESMARLGEGSVGCVVCRVDPADQQRLVQALSERDDYVLSVFTDVLRSSTERLHATYDFSAWILIAFSIAIGAPVVLNVTQANMLERKRELCVLRTLGFEHGRLARALLWQTLLFVGLACLVGLPAGKLVALRALQLISTSKRSFAYVNGFREYALTVVIVLGYALASHLLAMRGMRRWDINEGVKDKE